MIDLGLYGLLTREWHVKVKGGIAVRVGRGESLSFSQGPKYTVQDEHKLMSAGLRLDLRFMPRFDGPKEIQ